MIRGAELERSQPYPVCEIGEAMGGNQCRGVTWGQHFGGLRATCALGWWTGRGRTLGTCSAVSRDPCCEGGDTNQQCAQLEVEKKENLNTNVRTCKERGPFSSSFAGILASIYATIFTILFVSIIAYNKTSLSASLMPATSPASPDCSALCSSARRCYAASSQTRRSSSYSLTT